MTTEGDKPFVCTYPGCSQRFANDDHLAIHKTKHELSLKLGGKGTVLLVDQTPTPTRFLRNLEEAGLFSELEANPFEQGFKEATRKDGDPLTDKSTSSEGSSNDAVAKTVTISQPSVPVAPPPSLVNPQKLVPMATVPAHIGTATALTKQKLLASIHNRQLQQNNQQESTEVLAQALKAAIEQHGDKSNDDFLVPQDFPRRRGRKPDDEDPETKRQKFLERNRAAASRCRARKKQWIDTLDKKSKELEMLNTSLQQEVIVLRAEVQQLKSIILAHKDCPLMMSQAKQEEPTSGSGNNTVGVTLLSQLSSFSSLSPLVASPSGGATLLSSPLFLPNLPVTQSNADIAKSIEIASEISAHQQAD